VEPLDNPVWHALTGPQEKVAEARPGAARYHPDVAPFAAMPDAPSASSWDDLAALIGAGHGAVLFHLDGDPPPGWEVLVRVPMVQMVATSVEGAAFTAAQPLGKEDVDDMLALVERTQPGPFLRRTIELGDYIGVRDDGGLVAMAGLRMHGPGFCEISAVCTDESYRGRGLAAALVRDLVARIRERDETPMLHVLQTNRDARRVYEALGFTTRREPDAVVVCSPA
jgi:ribosomal protein S18 acetylase RimI-like enzyme